MKLKHTMLCICRRANMWAGSAVMVMMVLGFSSCNKDDSNDSLGAPVYRYQVTGTVTTTDSKPVKGIQVVVKTTSDTFKSGTDGTTGTVLYRNNRDTIYTDANGAFTSDVASSTSFTIEKVYFNDVDGDANGGVYTNSSATLDELTKTKVKDGDSKLNGGTYMFSIDKTMILKPNIINSIKKRN